jgi:hypothetical protein
MLQHDDFMKLRKLCDLYYQRQIDFVSYREQRREILDRIERELNRTPSVEHKVNDTQPRPRLEN